jgi:2-methylisocitrate lyase-like PEP mutase family enzyme
MSSPSTRLRSLIASGRLLTVPGAANALTARIVEEIGFEAVYVTGAGVANSFLGVPDVGLLSLAEIVAHVSAMREAVELPLIVDADTGFGNAVNVWHTVRSLERAGANAIQLEDQTFPKRCGHFDGKSVIAVEEMVEKLHAALDARREPELLIIARTDAASMPSTAAASVRGPTPIARRARICSLSRGRAASSRWNGSPRRSTGRSCSTSSRGA